MTRPAQETAREDLRRELQRVSKTALIALCRSGIPNPGGGRTHIFGAHPLEKWTKEEIMNTIIDVQFPPTSMAMDPLPLDLGDGQ
jgi:hypothetical protein